MTSFTRMHWTGVEPISIPSLGSIAQAVHDPSTASSVDFEALRRERVNARRIENMKWLCVGCCLSWIGFILLSL